MTTSAAYSITPIATGYNGVNACLVGKQGGVSDPLSTNTRDGLAAFPTALEVGLLIDYDYYVIYLFESGSMHYAGAAYGKRYVMGFGEFIILNICIRKYMINNLPLIVK